MSKEKTTLTKKEKELLKKLKKLEKLQPTIKQKSKQVVNIRIGDLSKPKRKQPARRKVAEKKQIGKIEPEIKKLANITNEPLQIQYETKFIRDIKESGGENIRNPNAFNNQLNDIKKMIEKQSKTEMDNLEMKLASDLAREMKRRESATNAEVQKIKQQYEEKAETYKKAISKLQTDLIARKDIIEELQQERENAPTEQVPFYDKRIEELQEAYNRLLRNNEELDMELSKVQEASAREIKLLEDENDKYKRALEQVSGELEAELKKEKQPAQSPASIPSSSVQILESPPAKEEKPKKQKKPKKQIEFIEPESEMSELEKLANMPLEIGSSSEPFEQEVEPPTEAKGKEKAKETKSLKAPKTTKQILTIPAPPPSPKPSVINPDAEINRLLDGRSIRGKREELKQLILKNPSQSAQGIILNFAKDNNIKLKQ